jgi:putative addiction module killer protein
MGYVLREYLEDSRSPFGEWFDGLDAVTRAKVHKGLIKLESGNRGNCRRLRAGVSELKIDYGPGYRVYFGVDLSSVIVLPGGGSKRRQQSDIEMAIHGWRNYLARKKKHGSD